MKVLVNGKVIGEITTNRSLTIEEVEGFYLDDCGCYSFDAEATEME